MWARLSLVSGFCFVAIATTGCGGPAEESALADANVVASKIPVQTATVVHSDVQTTIELVGSLIPRRRSVILPDVDGVVEEIPLSQANTVELEFAGKRITETPRLDIGSAVAKGDVLIQLDPTEYQLKLQAAEARLTTAMRQAEELYAWRRPEEIRRTTAEHEEAQARMELAVANLKRATELVGRNAMAKANLDQSDTDVKTAKASLACVAADLALARAGPTEEAKAVAVAAIAQSQTDVDRAKWELDKTTIRAPYDGVITDRFVDEGERVTAMPRVEIVELMDLSILTAQLGVAERYINRIDIGDSAEVFVKNSAQPVPGVVSLVNGKVDSETRTYRVRVSIPNGDRLLKVGQFVRVAIPIATSAKTLTVAREAVTYTGGEAHVFLYRDGRALMRPVELGLMNEETAEVISGLTIGDEIVVDDPSILSDGMAVQVSNPTSSVEPAPDVL